jgi:hypothetical protein
LRSVCSEMLDYFIKSCFVDASRKVAVAVKLRPVNHQ